MARDKGRKDQERRGKRSGEPGSGSGVGRREEVGGSGVYPASVGPDNIPEDAEVRTQAEWGQGERGAAGAEDSGRSELNYTLEESEALRKELKEKGIDPDEWNPESGGTGSG